MTLSPLSKKLFIVALVLIGVGCGLLVFAPKSTAPQNSTTNPVDTTLQTPEAIQPVPMINLYVKSGVNEESAVLDSEGRKLTAISLRFRADQNAVVKQNWFTLDPSLKEQGWQAAINTATKYDPEDEYAAFELALINTRPDGGTVFTSDVPFGTFASTIGSVYDLDPSTSMATTAEGNQLDLQLIREE